MIADDRFELLTTDEGRLALRDSKTGEVTMLLGIESAHELATKLNRFLMLGETDGHAAVADLQLAQRWLSTAEAMAYLAEAGARASEDTVRRAARAGDLLARKGPSGRWQFEQNAFVRWVQRTRRIEENGHNNGS